MKPPGGLESSRVGWRPNHRRAFTIMEVLVALGISALVLAGVMTFISMAATSIAGTASQTSINYRTSNASEFIFSRVRFATKVNNGGDTSGKTLRVGMDDNLGVDSNGDNLTYNDQDHYEIFQVVGNRLIYKPNENQAQTNVLIAAGIKTLPGKVIFTITNGATVLVNFAVADTYSSDGYQTCDIQGAIVPRNRSLSTNTINSIP